MVKVFNKRDEEMSYKLTLQQRPGFSWEFSPSSQLTLPAGKSAEIQLIVRTNNPQKGGSDEGVTVYMTYTENGMEKEVSATGSFYFPWQGD
jgi:hypothetical protein